MNLSHNTVLITGGASGIGLAMAEAFYKAGSVVAVCGRREDRLAAAAEALPGAGGIVPKPVKLEMGTGAFALSPQCQILYQRGSPGAKAAAP